MSRSFMTPVYAATPICSGTGLTISSAECEALADLYNSTVGTQWTTDTNWLDDVDVDTRYGVTVNSGTVTSIDLGANHLLGYLPASLVDLASLDTLDLENNLISTIANDFIGPASLTYLNLGYNSLETLPLGLNTLTGLVDLYLHNNELTSVPDILDAFGDLEILYLQRNSLTNLPDSLGDLDKVTIFDASHNDITVLPMTLGTMSALTILDLDSNDLTALDTSIGNLSNLQVIYAQDNQLTTLPESIGDLSELYYLGLDTNQISTLPSTFTNLTGLQYIRLDTNLLTTLPTGFSDLQELVTLYLNENNLESIDEEIGNVSGLRFLYMQENALTGTLPDTFSNLTILNRLYVYDNNLDREADHDAIIPNSLQSWYDALLASGKQIHLYDQEDITLPVVTIASQPETVNLTGVIIDLTYDENSYAVDTGGSGLVLAMSGNAACTSFVLDTTELTTMTGEVQLVLNGTGAFEGCSITVTDHAGNVGSVLLNDFVIGTGNADFCLLSAFTTPDAPPKIECLALVDFYVSTDGDNWTTTTNWFETTDVEEWFGIRTNIYNGQEHVDGLFLQKSEGADNNGIVSLWDGNGLDGTFPDSMHDLSELRYINISKNTLGVLPDTMSQLSNLQEWYALDAGIVGTLPASYDQLDALQVLQLPDNNLTGTISEAIYGMSALKNLSLANNALTGTLTNGIGALNQLQYLRVQGNMLSGPLPASVATLSSLLELNLSQNDFIGAIPSSYINLTSLETFITHENALDRDVNHQAIIPGSLSAWYSALTLKTTQDQRDITLPIISSVDTISWVVTGAFTYEITIDENSYAVDLDGEGMTVQIMGGGACTSLESTQIMTNSGLTSLTFTPTLSGGYADCILEVTDHAGNISDTLLLDSFVYGVGNHTVCYDPALTIDFAECSALIDMYDSTEGDSRYDQTNWTNIPDINTRFGITVTNNHVTDIQMGGVFANNLSGALPDSLGDLNYLETLDLHENKLSGALPSTITALGALTSLDLGNNLLVGTLPDDIGALSGITSLALNNNTFSGPLPTSLGDMTSLQDLDLQHNTFTTLPTSLSGLTQLQTVRLNHNSFNTTLPNIWSPMTQLVTLDLSNNTFNGGIEELSLLTTLVTLDISHNTFGGAIPSWLGGFTSLDYLSLAYNNFVDTFPSAWTGMTNINTLYVQDNNMDRDVDPTHDATIVSGSAIESRFNAISITQRDAQGDITLPTMTNGSTIAATVYGPLEYSFDVSENSYIIDSAGNGLTIYVTGSVLCSGIYIDTTEITVNDTTIDMTLVPSTHGAYNCFLHVVDHGGNDASLYIGPFFYDMTCGNGSIDTAEECDEGRFCDDGTNCTDDISLCPTECKPRFVDGCNPSCEPSFCGDGYVNTLGADEIAGTNDDEVCDPGSYCANGTDCSRDPDICPTGAAECLPRYLEGCSPTCVSAECGDGTLDGDGADNLTGTVDDEECDDGNVDNGDGCSDSCRGEYCGDAYVDPDGIDNNISTTADNEGCDDGLANGLVAGVCTSTCTDPNEACIPCRQHCNELLDGGTGAHQIYLLVDRSGSMNGFERLENAKAATTGFVNLLPGVIYSGGSIYSGSEVGLVTFQNSATNDISPTDDYTGVITTIEGISANGVSNISDALDIATDWFINSGDTSSSWHIILLSDGEPTLPGGSDNAEDAAEDSADAAKDEGIEIYTIGLQQGINGKELLTYIATSTGHYYEDPTNNIMKEIYQEIYGRVQCGCEVQYICDICGDKDIRYNEECDEGSFCDDDTDCTDDPGLCPEECRPRFTNGCTDTCRFDYCGDGQLNEPAEGCDDGNTIDGDGCSALCQLETCGDGYLDADGADNIPNNTDDEHCDDGNTTAGDGCNDTCKHEFCGDDYVDLNGPDDNSATTGDNEMCDTGRSCNNGDDCTDDPWMCPGECIARYEGLCTDLCDIGTCGDSYVQSGSLAVGTGTVTMDEACDLGLRCEDKFTPCGDLPTICGLLGIGGGTCAPRTIGACTEVCTINVCGDGYLGGAEQCDDGNTINGDGCNASCISERCGDGIADDNGPDNILNTMDDELCDDGNTVDDDGCTLCKLDSCGDGVLDTGEECDTVDTNICVLPYCRLTFCGDSVRQWPNGQGTGGSSDDGYEECDGDAGCIADCTYTGSTTFCGDDIIQTPNDLGLTEVCDDGVNNGTIGYCSLDCLEMPTCGNGVVTDAEECDDGNVDDDDGCSSICVLENPLIVPAGLSGECISGHLPVINVGELLPLWWQLETVDAVASGASTCGEVGPGEWILDQGMQCTFGLSAGSIYGQSVVNISFTTDCLDLQHQASSLLGDAVTTHANDTGTYPLLGSALIDGSAFSGQFTEQQGQYTLTLDSISYDYCVTNASGSTLLQSAIYDTESLCSLDLPVTVDYIVQQGAALQEVATTSLDSFIDTNGATLLTVGTLLDDDTVNQEQSSYQGTDISYLTQDFSTKYEKLGVVLLQGIWGVDIWKVPNQRTYVYKDTAPLTLDQLEIEQIVGDLTEPFTFVVTDADFTLDGSLGSLGTKTVGMFVVSGGITFSSTICDTTDVVQGLFIAEDGFVTTLTKNISPSANEWCDGGNMIIQGLLIGGGIDSIRSQRRATLDAWDTDTIAYTSYDDAAGTLGAEARKVFDICYFPALVEGMTTTLDDNGTLCDHANIADFVDMASSTLSPHVEQWLLDVKGISCVQPTTCTGPIPSFSCLYDDSDCVVETDLDCGARSYACTILADEVNQQTTNERVRDCVPNETSSCIAPYQECTVDMLTNTLTCIEHCNDAGEMTCPTIGMLPRHDAVQSMVEQGLPRVPTASTMRVKKAFDAFDRDLIEIELDVFSMTLAPNDTGWLSNTPNTTAFDTELENRKSTITAGSAVVIETAPWLWKSLPPGGSEMLNRVEYLSR